MRKLLGLCMTAALLLTALAIPPLSGASRIDKKNEKRAAAPGGAGKARLRAQTR